MARPATYDELCDRIATMDRILTEARTLIEHASVLINNIQKSGNGGPMLAGWLEDYDKFKAPV